MPEASVARLVVWLAEEHWTTTKMATWTIVTLLELSLLLQVVAAPSSVVSAGLFITFLATIVIVNTCSYIKSRSK